MLPRCSTSLRQDLGSRYIFVFFFASINVEHINKLIWGFRAVILKISPHIAQSDRGVIAGRNHKTSGILENRSKKSTINSQAVALPLAWSFLT